ncbi:MAG: FAD-binding protein [Clostridia bacterium]|nr:FAD-binding protein [Clostridia bacterium]
MICLNNVSMPLSYTEEQLKEAAAKKLKISVKDISQFSICKRSIDARRGTVSFIFSLYVEVLLDEKRLVTSCKDGCAKLVNMEPYSYLEARKNKDSHPVVVGSGPAGLFAALVLAESGLQPIVFERGQDVETRVKSVKEFNLTGVLNPESNIQFGEGGAGTFSDGKLNTGIHNSRIRFVLEQFAKFADASDVLWQAKPHVGTDRLCVFVKKLREYLISLGTTFSFDTKVCDIVVKNNQLQGLVIMQKGKTSVFDCQNAIFAIGHSARDTFQMLFDKGLLMEQKPFAVGVRIEHKRESIDKARYGSFAGSPQLGAADYRLAVHPKNGRGVYTFCMCPGGRVVAAASEENMVVTNGMSLYAREEENSNSAVLVGVSSEDYPSSNPLAGVILQQTIEKRAFVDGGGAYQAPCQMVGDFLEGKPSKSFKTVKPSYERGVRPSNIENCLPKPVCDSLKIGIPMMGKQITGFDHKEALLTGVESRTSSPVRLLRRDDGQSCIEGIYPSGEGAGYAGGIVSSAVDGMKSAELLIQNFYQ